MTIVDETIHAVATDGFRYVDGRLRCGPGSVDLHDLAAQVGTPCYVYDAAGIQGRYRSMEAAFAPIGGSIRYAVKANPNPAVLRLLASLGAGMDVVSEGELERAWLSGAAMDHICMAGVAKSDDELRSAMDGRYSSLCGCAVRDPSDRGPIGLINVESEAELSRIEIVAAELGVEPSVAIRVNPGVTAGAHEHVRVGGATSKFGLPPFDAIRAARTAAASEHMRFRGLHMHIGSQITDLERFDAALGVMASIANELRSAGIDVDIIDVGAGVAVSYLGEPAPSDAAFAETLARGLSEEIARGTSILVEPGRELVAQAGVLLTRVRHVKTAGDRTIVVTDAGLNALVRPAMYKARHMVWPVVCDARLAPYPIAPPVDPAREGLRRVDVVGPVCESSDEFLKDWLMPEVFRDDVLAVMTAGAYGMSMAMTFNDLPLPAEIMIEADGARVVRARRSVADLIAARSRTDWGDG